MRRRVGVEDKSRFSINDISLGEDLGFINAFDNSRGLRYCSQLYTSYILMRA